MAKSHSLVIVGLSAVVACTINVEVAIAKKPDHSGGKHQKSHGKEQHYESGGRHYDDEGYANTRTLPPPYRDGSYFIDRHRSITRDYYAQEYRSGHCPPGLAKKHNGCLPAGQAKKWAIGQPLPRDMVYYDLPPSLVAGFGPPPPGYRYVRVASDILMIAVGSSMVMDAIHDLGGW